MVAETSRKALANAFTRKNFESTQNKRLLEKQVKGVSIVNEINRVKYKIVLWKNDLTILFSNCYKLYSIIVPI